VYQIDFTAVDAGKRIASSKRRIRWRFGFTNQDALASGETGTACRGEEHDITLIWSLTSGKRLVLADGQEVHYSNSRSQIFDFSWTMRGNHVLKVVAHGTTPMNAHPNFRQYEFFVDGMSFFTMPKVYRLGLTGAEPIHDRGTLALAHSSRRSAYNNYSVGGQGHGQHAGGGIHSGARSVNSPGTRGGPSSIVEIEAPHNQHEEEAYLREAIKASLSEQEQEQQMNAAPNAIFNGTSTSQPNTQDDLLIDFMSEPGPAPAPAPGNHMATGGGFDAFAIVPAAAPPTSIYALATPPQNYAVAAPPAMAPPVPPAAPPAVYNYNHTPYPAAPPPAPYSAPPVPAPLPMQESASSLTMAPQSTGLGSDANAAYAKFANMDQFDLVKPTSKKDNRSNPFETPIAAPSSFSGAAGGSGTLADMKANKSNGGEKKEVMKSMVVAPQQGGNWGVGRGGGGGGNGGYNNYGMQMQGGAGMPMAAAQPAPSQMQGQYGMGMTAAPSNTNAAPVPMMGGNAAHVGGMQQGYQQQYGYAQPPQQQQPGQQYPPQQQYQHPQTQYGHGQAQQQPF